MEALEEAPELLGVLRGKKKHFMMSWKQDLLAEECGLEYMSFIFPYVLWS